MMIYALVRTMLFPLFRRRLASVSGLEHLPTDKSFLLAANHIDFLDGFYITAALHGQCRRRIRFLSETANYWWTGGATIPVNPTDKGASIASVAQALASGDPVCFFVEGKRNAEPMFLPPKTGVARASLATGAAIIPVGIIGPSGASFLHSVQTLLFGKTKYHIRVGSALTAYSPLQQDSTDADVRVLLDRVMNALAPLAEKRYSPY